MIIIALSGKKKSGKNTVAKLIAAATNLSCKEYAFADALKSEVARACGVSTAYIEQNKDSFRLILQGWGTDFKRNLVDKDYWVKELNKQLLQCTADIAIITDVRFMNEFKYLNSAGAVLVRISRPNIPLDEHPSESDLDKIKQWHEIILNSTTVDDLVPQVKELLTKINIQIK